MSKSITSTTLCNKYHEVSEECRTSGEPVVVTHLGEAELVVMSIEAYEKLLAAQPESAPKQTPSADDIMASIFSGFAPAPAAASEDDKRMQMMELDQEAAQRSAEIEAMDASEDEKALMRDEMSKWYSRRFKEITNA